MSSSQRTLKKRIFQRGGPTVKTTVYPDGISSRFKNTRVTILENKEIGPKDNKETGNILQLLRTQATDIEAFCTRTKLKVIGGKATTMCNIGLTDEALEALYIILKIRFEGMPREWELRNRVVNKDWNSDELRTFIDGWPAEMSDPHLAKWLNDMELPHDQYMMAINYYKKIGPYELNNNNEKNEQNP